VRVHVWQECVSASKADGGARPTTDGGTGPNLAFTIFAGCHYGAVCRGLARRAARVAATLH
jgi:hypothetical protein